MQQDVTITRTTTITASQFSFHTGYVKSPPGILKALETVLGIVSLGLLVHYCRPLNSLGRKWFVAGPEETFFFLTICTFLLTTYLLLISCTISFPTASFIPKTIYELLYHCLASVFYLCGSVSVLTVVLLRNEHLQVKEHGYLGKIIAAVVGLVNTMLYLGSSFFSFRSYRQN
ncbi:CKLF-like MARVEL transmembrane domain-containing protein 8 [Tachypleus tridentatus]|uniref:CKLF-like MARVEL transmembrane domain-containing protein 8 n=1 Tax=Tachypleus tridentatus TaxID=6853 RepID=UPI003FD258D8